ncbi:hypothetical protein G6O67_002543 [Ophiocordyceps sinensis]|uniref:Uncharacterized protein n=2 Tax=Ophiocordyceps sinensis TaxID=72228 RepID=A0A8H4PUE6_9HYPO|nr:hypothetical protein OCS_04818 [Ophiocordyceps sinensis CO18]KAF4510668.1 hypothetical protein G6O67_002543 [Ophiocordyceps sinensis]
MASLSPAVPASSPAHLQVPGVAAVPTSSSSAVPVRPKFNSHLTSDRLREGAGLYLPPAFRTDRSNIRKDRTSVFKELGLDDPHCAPPSPVVILGHRHLLSAAAAPQPCPQATA